MNFIALEISTGKFFKVASINLKDDYCVEVYNIDENNEIITKWLSANEFVLYKLVK